MRDKLESFLRRVFVRISGITDADLRAGGGKRGRVIDSFSIVQVGDDEIRELASQLVESAQNHADSLSGAQRYEVSLLKDGTDVATFPFRLKSSSDTGLEELTSDRPATEEALRQALRHNESMARLYMNGMQSALGTLAERAQQDAQIIKDLRIEQSNTITTLERARSEEAEREIAMLRHIDRQKLEAWTIQKIDTVLPMIMARLSGKKLIGDGKEASQFQDFLTGLSAEQLGQIASCFTPTQQVVFFDLLRQFTADAKKSNHVS